MGQRGHQFSRRGSALPSRRQVDASPRDRSSPCIVSSNSTQARHAPTLNEPLLTPHEAAVLLAVRVSWIYDAVRGDRLPCIRVGRHVRFLRPDLERWIADQRG
ncbi:MAG: helix-turn-helix domain-containing protein [Solirubrobacteraceae bacterium]